MSEKRPSDDAQGGPKGKRTKPTEQKFQGVEVILCCSPVSATEAMNIGVHSPISTYHTTWLRGGFLHTLYVLISFQRVLSTRTE